MTYDSSITVTYISQEEQADPEHIHQAFSNTRYLPHVVNGQFEGGHARTTFVLFNPGDVTHSMILSLTKDDGSPLDVNIPGLGGQGNHFGGLLRPAETQIVQTDGTLELSSGAATVTATGPIGVSAIFSIFDATGNPLTETGVGSPEPLVDVVIPVDSIGQFDTGRALFNTKSEAAFVEFQLLDESGQEAAPSTDITLSGSGHRALFVAGDLFPSVGDFRGSLIISSSRPLAVLSLRQNAVPLSLTSLPAVSRSSTQLQFDLPHVANGEFTGGVIQTTFVLFNISSNQATVDLSLTRDDGTPWEVTIPAAGTNSTFRVGLDPGESKFLQTDGLGTVTTGAAIVSFDSPIGVSAIFSIFDEQGDLLTETGVGASTPLKETVIPIDVTGSFDTGIALFNQGDATVTVASSPW